MKDGHLLSAMQIFISVVESGSFSEAARRLTLSQPSISRQINSLEEHLGVRLLQRTTRRLSLTEAGQVYYDKAREIQRAVTEADQSISGFKESPAGVLRIGAPHTWTENKIAPYLGEFLSRYPDIQVDIRCHDHIQDMVEERLDLVIRVGLATDSSFIAVPFAKVGLKLCASASYLERYGQPKTLSDLHNHKHIVHDRCQQLTFVQGDEETSILLDAALTTNSVSVMFSSLQQNIGLSIMPDLLIKPELESGEFVEVLPEYEVKVKGLPVDQVFAMYSSRKQMPAKVRAFIDFYRDKFDKDVARPVLSS